MRRRRVPWVVQMGVADCGPACLAMILAYHGRDTVLEDIRETMGTGRDGASALAILEAAAHYGLEARCLQVDSPSYLRALYLPAIVHWNHSHFVVLESWSAQGAVVVDPSFGRCEMTSAEFSAAFQGIVLELRPGPGFRPARRSAFPMGRYLQHLLSERRLVGSIMPASLALQLIGLTMPAVMALVVDRAIPQRSIGMLVSVGMGLAALVLAQGSIALTRQWLLSTLHARVDRSMMLQFFDRLLRLPYSFFQARASGDLLMRLNSNLYVREVLSTQVLSTVLDGLLVVIYLGLLLVMSPTMAALATGLGLLQVLMTLISVRVIQARVQREIMAQSRGQSYLAEALHGMSTIKACGLEERTFEHWQRLFADQLRVTLSRERAQCVSGALAGALSMANPLVLLLAGAAMVSHANLSLGTMLGLISLGGAFLAPLTALVRSTEQFQLVGTHLARLEDVFVAQPEQGGQTLPEASTLRGHISLRGVGFAYSRRAPEVLQGVDLEIHPGQLVGIVGPSGSGKSTLAKIIAALYEPSAGAVLYDGVPAGQVKLQSLRRQIGVVLQEVFLFNDSIRKNIALHDPDMALDEIGRAATLAAIHEDILHMPLGYDTHLSESGDNISGGQRQRLSLARALAHRPAILILDEATSELDSRTERIIQQNLTPLKCTRVVIAHRLSTIRQADLILVLDRGRIVERGKHEELLALEGLYASLVAEQSGTSPAVRRAHKLGNSSSESRRSPAHPDGPPITRPRIRGSVSQNIEDQGDHPSVQRTDS